VRVTSPKPQRRREEEEPFISILKKTEKPKVY
jgi:hypothetical protein